MSHINYLPLKRPFQRAIEVRDKSFLWPSAVSLALHLPFILAIIAIGNMRPQLGDNMGTAMIWIPTAMLQQEALAASKPESLPSSDYQEEPEEENDIPAPNMNTSPIGMDVVSASHYPANAPATEGKKGDPATKVAECPPVANNQVVLSRFSSAAQPSKPRPAARAEVKNIGRQELANNGGKSRSKTPIPVVPPPPAKKEEKKPPSISPVPMVAPTQSAKPDSTAIKPALTAKIIGVASPSPVAKTAPAGASATSGTGGMDRNPPGNPTLAAQQQPAHAQPLEQTPKKPEPALQLPLKAAVTMQHPVGIFDAPLHGDLHLEINGEALVGKNINMVVLFRQYPKNRHNRPMSPTEAKRVKTLAPRMARVRDTALQFAVETAPDGIYEFKAMGGNALEGSCVVTIMTGDKKKVVRNLGTRQLGRALIVKILMPEGLVWENDTAFTGSMEDSESITKYNADTGLTWREYKTSEN